MTWSGASQLAGVTGLAAYAYAPDGSRLAKTTASGTTLYLGPDLERDPAGTWTKYVHPDAVVIGSGAAAATTWLTRDHSQSIRLARGTLPLALFDPNKYAALMGRIALPSLLAQASAPLLGALLIATHGAGAALGALAAAAALNVGLVTALAIILQGRLQSESVVRGHS